MTSSSKSKQWRHRTNFQGYVPLHTVVGCSQQLTLTRLRELEEPVRDRISVKPLVRIYVIASEKKFPSAGIEPRSPWTKSFTKRTFFHCTSRPRQNTLVISWSLLEHFCVLWVRHFIIKRVVFLIINLIVHLIFIIFIALYVFILIMHVSVY